MVEPSEPNQETVSGPDESQPSRGRDGSSNADGLSSAESASREATLRRALVSLGLLLLLVALLPELRNVPDVQVGRSQWLLILVAGIVAVLGLLGRKAAQAYRACAFLLLNTLIALALVELGATAANILLGSSAEPAPVEFETARSNEYFADKPWADAFWAEEEEAQVGPENYHPYVIWRGAPYEGTYVRVDGNGFRHTPGSTCTEDAYHIVMFGSSALWGWGVPDDGTIPAFLQAELGERDQPICVTNRAQNAFVSTQDLIEFVRLLQAGDRIDLALFFHGFNDASAMFETQDAGAHYMVDLIADKLAPAEDPSFMRSVLGSTATAHLVRRLVTRNAPPPGPRWPPLPESEVPEASRGAVRAYFTNLDAIRGLAERAGIDVAFFWQPYADWGRSSSEQLAVPGAGSFDGRQSLIHSVYQAIRDTADVVPDLEFTADDFVDVDPSIWLDYVHLAPAGNERVAGLMLAKVPGGLPPL